MNKPTCLCGECRVCKRRVVKRRYMANRSEESKERQHQRQREWNQRNRGRNRGSATAWNRANPLLHKAYAAACLANDRHGGHRLKGKDVLEIWRRDDFICHWCGEGPLAAGVLSLDHVYPDGGNDKENLVTACRPCNVMKLDNTPEEFLARVTAIFMRYCCNSGVRETVRENKDAHRVE